MLNVVYVLMGQKNDWESEPFCVGAFSTEDKATEVLPKANETFPNHNFWIEPTAIDVFDWK